MIPLNTVLPSFELDGVNPSKDFANVPLLVAFLCNHCPYVVHIRQDFVRVAHAALDRGVQVLAINSNSEISHPQDGPTAMRALAKSEGWRFPFVFDRSQDVAKAFDAQCTPEFYLFNAAHRLVYRGRFDESTPKNGKPVSGNELSDAIDALVHHRPITDAQHPSIGCSIKWNA